MAKRKKSTTHSDNMITLFQGKTFTVLFFVGICLLFTGAFYLMMV